VIPSPVGCFVFLPADSPVLGSTDLLVLPTPTDRLVRGQTQPCHIVEPDRVRLQRARRGHGSGSGQMSLMHFCSGRRSCRSRSRKKYGDRGATYASMASNLNACGRMPWRTDQKHIQGRLQHLMDARRAHQRVSARATGIEEEHGEVECLLEDLIDESDRFKASETERCDTLRERDMALAESGRKARELAMSRQAPAEDAESIDGSDGGGSDVNFDSDVNLDVEGQERSTATPSSTRSPEFFSGDVEAQVLALLRENASSVAARMERSATTEERRLQAETEREGEKKSFKKRSLK
jgi:hypothetical protein